MGAAGFAGADENDERLPKPLEVLVDVFCTGGCALGGDFGAESKKLPPPPNRLDVVDVALGLEKLSSPAKGDGFGGGAAGAPNERLLKASLMPPKPLPWVVCCCEAPRPPKESCRACCWGGGGAAAAAGFDAYSAKMDCFRSGREGVAAAGPVLEGRAGCAGAVPRKSSPNNESPALVCLGGAGSALGGTAVEIGGPVLGR